MKAFLLAAGHGTRLRPITDSIPKCLVPIQGKPLLQIWLELCQLYGIEEVLVNLHAHADQVESFLAKQRLPIRVRVSEERQLLGSAGTLKTNSEWVWGEEAFWIFYADVLTAANLGEMKRFHDRCGTCATLGTYRVPDPTRCGILSADSDGIVREFVEKPAQPKDNLAFAGIMIANPEILQYIPDTVPADIGFHVLPQLVNRMAAYTVEDYLIDIGTMENYNRAQETWPGVIGQTQIC